MSLFHEVRGQGGPALVFVHGLSCDHTDWEAQVERFHGEHRCISMDLPGHGRSPAHGRALDIERFIDETHALLGSLLLPGERVVLFGHSMGCRVAVGVAARLAQQAAGVVLVDGSCFGSGDPETVRDAVTRKVASVGVSQTLRQTFASMFTADSPPQLVARIMDRALAMNPMLAPGLLADMAAWDAANIERVTRGLHMPVMAIQSTSVDAERNRVIIAPGEGSDYTDALARWLPEPRIEILPGIGHFTMIEAASDVNELVEDFVRQL